MTGPDSVDHGVDFKAIETDQLDWSIESLTDEVPEGAVPGVENTKLNDAPLIQCFAKNDGFMAATEGLTQELNRFGVDLEL